MRFPLKTSTGLLCAPGLGVNTSSQHSWSVYQVPELPSLQTSPHTTGVAGSPKFKNPVFIMPRYSLISQIVNSVITFLTET